MINKLMTQAYVSLSLCNMKKDERGITAIEYAIIGVAMSSALFFIFDKGGFIQSLSNVNQRLNSNTMRVNPAAR